MPQVKVRDNVQAGDILGLVQETTAIEHKVMVPPGVKGTVKEIMVGNYAITEPICL